MDLDSLSASSAYRSVTSGALSASELLDAVLTRIARAEPRINALTAVLTDEARRDARRLDDAHAAGDPPGPLHGVPIVVKDLYDVAGHVTTCSSRVRADATPATRDAEVVTRLRAAGAVIVAKSQTHEFAYGGLTPQTRNPWDLGRIAGGSSGGSAAALAVGEALGALGTDTAGSIRIPASCCGVVGLKPTFGRVSRRGLTPLSWSLDHAGPLGRSVEDVARLLQVLAGHDALDPFSADRPVDDYVSSLHDGVGGLVVALAPGYYFDRCDARVVAAVRALADDLSTAGATLREIDAPLADSYVEAEFTIVMSEASDYHRDTLASRPGDYEAMTRERLEAGRSILAVDYVRAQRERHRVRRAWTEAMAQVDVLLAPTLPGIAPRAGATEVGHDDGSDEEVDASLTRLNLVHDLTGFPALSLPGGLLDGMPWGVQLVARPFEEARLLRAARVVEDLCAPALAGARPRAWE